MQERKYGFGRPETAAKSELSNFCSFGERETLKSWLKREIALKMVEIGGDLGSNLLGD